MSDSNKKYPVVVLGIGNILWADEGFGVRAVEAFNEAWKCPEDVLVLDGGTLGFYLSEYIESCSKIIIFDACEFNELPGTCKVLKKEDINPWLNTKMSAHQEGLNDLFAVAKLLGRYPDEIVVLGCQPGDLEDYGGSLTPEVSAAVPGMVEEAAKQLKEWGFKIEPRMKKQKRSANPALSVSLMKKAARRKKRLAATQTSGSFQKEIRMETRSLKRSENHVYCDSDEGRFGFR